MRSNAADGVLSATDEGGDAGGGVWPVSAAVVAEDGVDVVGGEFFEGGEGGGHVGGVFGSGADEGAVDDAELVAGDEQAAGFDIEADVAGRVAGGVDDFEAAVPGKKFAVFEGARHGGVGEGGEGGGRTGAQRGRESGDAGGDLFRGELVVGEGAFDVGLFEAVGADEDAIAGGEEVGQGADVVPVLVGEDDAAELGEGDAGALDGLAEAGEEAGVAGVDEGGAVCFVADEDGVDGAGGAEDVGVDGEGLDAGGICHWSRDVVPPSPPGVVLSG